MKATKNIDIYLIGKRPVKVIDVVQYDTGIQLVFTVKDFTIPTDATAKLYAQKPSGKFVWQEDKITIANNTITVDLENQALTEYGRIPYQVTISSGSDTATSFAGLMIVERKLNDAGAVESKTVIKAFDEVTADKIAEFQENAKAIADSVIATIPDDYTELTAKVNESANAIKGHLSGAVVAADDVSPVEHLMNVKVKSKNMIPYPYHHESGIIQQGVVITYDANGVITFNGTALADSAFRLINNASIRVKGKYTLSGCDGGSNTTYYLQPFIDGKGVGTVRDGSITYEWDGYLTSLAFFFKAGVTFNNVKFAPQLEEGTKATEHTPYIDPSTVKVTRCGKNLVKYPYSEMDKTRAGITYSVMEDGTIKYNGTSTGSYLSLATIEDEKVYLHKGVKYTLSGMPSNSSMQTAYAHITESDGTTRHYIAKDNNTFTAESSGYAKVTLVVSEGTVANNQIFKPMLEASGTATDFEPYNGTEYIPTAVGKIDGLTSLSPTMTILTDTEGVIVECEYHKDTNKVIQKLADALGITI